MRAKISTIGILTALLLPGPSLMAQNTSGSITGVVQDASGAVIPGAQATLINQEQGVTARDTITNEAGIYLFSALPAATYTVTVELPGFKTYKKTDVKLFVNDRMPAAGRPGSRITGGIGHCGSYRGHAGDGIGGAVRHRDK